MAIILVIMPLRLVVQSFYGKVAFFFVGILVLFLQYEITISYYIVDAGPYWPELVGELAVCTVMVIYILMALFVPVVTS